MNHAKAITKKKTTSKCYVHKTIIKRDSLPYTQNTTKILCYYSTLKSPYLVWTGWDSVTTALLDELSSKTGLSIEYIGGGDFLIFMFEKLRITELVREHFFLTRFWANWNK